VSDIHSAAAIALQAHFIEGFCIGFAIRQALLEFFPLVGDYAATAETSYWNNHHITSSVGLLLLAASTTAQLVFGLLSAWVVHEKAAVKAQVFVSKFFVNTFGTAVVVDQATCNSGSNGIGLTHDATAVGGDGDVDFAQSVHGIGDHQGFHRLSASQGRLHDFNGFGVDTNTAFACFYRGTGHGGLSLARGFY
jgi:hypothetical protein